MKALYNIKKIFNVNLTLYIILIWLLFSTVAYLHVYTDYLSKFIGIFGIIVSFININKIKFRIENIFLILLFSFIGISTLINYHNNLYLNLVMIMFMLVFVLLSLEYNHNSKYEKTFYNLYIIITTVLAFASVCLYFTKTELLFLGNYYGYHWNVLYGLFVNPNTGSICLIFSILLSIYLFLKDKKIIYIISSIINFAYVFLADSRGAYITFIIFIFSYLAIMIYIKSKKWYIYLLLIFSFLFSTIIAIKSPYLIATNIYNDISYKFISNNDFLSENKVDSYIESDNNEEEINSAISEEEGDSAVNEGEINSSISEDVIVQEESPNNLDNTKDISSSRFDLWKASFNVIKEHLFFGVGKAGQMDYVREYLDPNSQTYFIVAGGPHNGYIDLLLSNGFFAFVTLIIVLGMRVLKLLSVLIEKKEAPRDYFYFISIFLALLVNNMFETSFFNAIFITCLFFWFVFSKILFLENEISNRI